MSRLFLGLVAAVFVPALASAQDGDGWITMFNGKDTTGWKINENPESWSIVDGAIRAQGDRSHLFFVGTNADGETAKTLDKPFENFEFHCEVKTEPGANGGIYFHTRYQDTGWPAGGFEAQVNNSQKDWKRTGSLYSVVNVTEAPADDNEWFPYMIKVEGDHVRIECNGKVCVDYTQPRGAKPGKGFDRVLGAGTFALQAHDPGSVVYWRNMKVKRIE